MSGQFPFERSVFINGPFDDAFAPILQAMAFCVTDLGFHPRLAPENADNATHRLDRIVDLIRGAKFGIHVLIPTAHAMGRWYSALSDPQAPGANLRFAWLSPDDRRAAFAASARVKRSGRWYSALSDPQTPGANLRFAWLSPDDRRAASGLASAGTRRS